MKDLLTLISLALTCGAGVLAVLLARAHKAGKVEAERKLAFAQELVAVLQGVISMFGKEGPKAASTGPGLSQAETEALHQSDLTHLTTPPETPGGPESSPTSSTPTSSPNKEPQ
jgi:hypothetical protein